MYRLTALALLLSLLFSVQLVASIPVASVHPRLFGLSSKPKAPAPVAKAPPTTAPATKVPPKTGTTTKPPSANVPAKPPASSSPAKATAKQPATSAASCPVTPSKKTRDIVKRADVCGISGRQQNLAQDACEANAQSITFSPANTLEHSSGPQVDGTQCDHIVELQITQSALRDSTACNALDAMVAAAAAAEVATNGLSVVKQDVLQTLFVKLNADARNLFFLSAAENGAKGRLVGAVIGGQQPANDPTTKNVGAYIRFVDGGAGTNGQVSQFAASLDQVVDNILAETAQEAKTAIAAKLAAAGSDRQRTICNNQDTQIDQLLAGATGHGAIAAKWAAVKTAALAR